MCFNVYFWSSKINNYAIFSYISKLSSETGQKDVENSDTPIDSSKNPTTQVKRQNLYEFLSSVVQCLQIHNAH